LQGGEAEVYAIQISNAAPPGEIAVEPCATP
jgi:hypothetical protein